MLDYTNSGAEAEEEPVIYIRYLSNSSYHWVALKNDAADVSSKATVCACGAKVHLVPCFPDKTLFHSSIVAVGSRIYSFGGFDLSINTYSDEVSYIDTLHAEDGWTKCQGRMLRAQSLPYTIALDEDRVFLVGGKPYRGYEPTFTQMYYTNADKFVPLVNNFDNPQVFGHAIVDKTCVLMHSCYSPKLYSYNVDKNQWGEHWCDGLEGSKHTSALLDGILYVLGGSYLASEQNLVFSGYDVSLEYPKRLPIEVRMGNRVELDDEEWFPMVAPDGSMAAAKLFSLGNSKLAMIWHYICAQKKDLYREKLSVMCSIFMMVKEKDAEGGLRLVAQPLSNMCYHIDGYSFNRCVVVYPSKNVSTNRKRKTIEEENE